MNHSQRMDPDQAVLLGVVLLSAIVDMPRAVQLGSVSLLGVITLVQLSAIWLIWLQRPLLPAGVPGLLPLLAFDALACASLLWSPYPWPGFQTAAVHLSLLGAFLVSLRQAQIDGRHARQLCRWIGIAAILASGLYAVPALVPGMPELVGDRTFALLALIGMGWWLAQWQLGSRLALGAALLLTGAILLSMSRMAFIMGLALFPIAVALRGGRHAIVRAGIMCAIMGGIAAAAILLYQPMYERFFGYDLSFSVGGVAINASGRADVWQAVYRSFLTHPWLGQGLGSTSQLTNLPGMGHPHNDYLLLAHDCGIVGLALWLTAMGAFAVHTLKRLRREPGNADIHLCAILALLGVLGPAATDNPLSYMFLLSPLGVILGCSLGIAPPAARGHSTEDASHENPALPRLLPATRWRRPGLCR